MGAKDRVKVTASEEQGRPQRPSPPVKTAPSAKAYWVRSFLGSALVLLVATALAVALVMKRESSRDLRHLADGARLLAQAIASDISRVTGLIEAAAADGEVRHALASPHPEVLHSAELGLLRLLPDAFGMHLFPAARIDSVKDVPAMSYAGLDLARQAAQRRQVTPAEAHKVGQPDMHLAIAGPVFDEQGERVLGVVHLTLPVSLLPSLDGLLAGVGTAIYRQVVGDQPVPLDGAAREPEHPPDGVVEIPRTRLQIAVWLAPRDFPDAQLLEGAAAVYLSVLGLIAALLWLGHRGLRGALLEDLQGLILMVEDLLQQRPIRKPMSRLAETQRAHLDLMTQLRTLGGQLGRGSQAARPTGRAQGSETGRGPSGASSEQAALDDSGGLDALDELDELELPDQVDVAASGSGQTGADHFGSAQAGRTGTQPRALQLPETIFRAYDIRGLVDGQLTADAVQAIGWSLGSAAVAGGDRTVFLGRDCRSTSPELSAALAAGIRSAGPDVVDLGVVPSPLVYFACCHAERHAGAAVTGSHNPLGYNGVKPVLAGRSATTDEIQDLRRRLEAGDLVTGTGGYRQLDLIPEYRAYIEHDVALARTLRLAIDCANGTASAVAPGLYRALGCEVIERRCELCGGGDDAVTDPSVPEHLRPLGELVVAEGADLGLAFDGDGDRLGVVDSRGRFIPADRVLMLLASDVLSRNPGTDVIFDVKCSRHLAEEILRAGGRPVMWRSGHAPLKAKLREGGALIAGELSGHIIFQERWLGFDDAVYAGARLLEVLSLDPRTSQEIFDALPSGIVTPELALELREGESARVMDAVIRHAGELEGAELILIDGLRAEFEAGWGLVRASNTEPKLTLRFEGEDQAALEAIQSRFRRLFDRAAPGLALPF